MCPTQPSLPPFVQDGTFFLLSHLFLFLPLNANVKSGALAPPGNFFEYKILLYPFISAFLVGEVASLLATTHSGLLSIFYESLEVLTVQKFCSLCCLYYLVGFPWCLHVTLIMQMADIPTRPLSVIENLTPQLPSF